MRMAASSKQTEENEEESVTLATLTVEGDCVLDPYDSRYCKANEVVSVLINGGPGWLGHKRTYAINDPFQ